MPAVRLERRLVPKVWGRRDVPRHFRPWPEDGEPLGEIWFPDPSGNDAELLIKYLFTSEKLSIQVHPDDQAARAAGYARGKDEAWVILSADPGAVIGLGLVEPLSAEELRASALDGSLERLIDWRPVTAGDVIYSTAGTIHALGAGLILIEIQQNLDLTYRLYDYGRPRELHLDEAVEVAVRTPYRGEAACEPISEGRERLVAGAFVLERWSGHEQAIGEDDEAPVWLIPIAEGAVADGVPLEAGSVWVSRGPTRVAAPANGDLLVAYAGGEIRP